MQLSTEWTKSQDMEDERQTQAHWRSESESSESRVEDEHLSASTVLDAWTLFDNVLRNSRSEEFSCGCFSSVHSRWRNRRESSEQTKIQKRGGQTTSRSVWCENE